MTLNINPKDFFLFYEIDKIYSIILIFLQQYLCFKYVSAKNKFLNFKVNF